MAEDTIHTRTFQVTVRFTDEQRDRFIECVQGSISDAIRSEIIRNLQGVGLDASVTTIQRMEAG